MADRRMTEEGLQAVRERHVRRFGDPMYAEHDDIGALIDEVQACWAELRRIRLDNQYLRDHIGNVVGYVLAHQDPR